LDRGGAAEGLLPAGVQPFAAIEDHQQPVLIPQPAGFESLEKLRTDLGVLRARFHKAEHHLLAAERHAQRHHHRVVREGLAVEKQRHEVVVLQRPLVELL